MGWKVEFADSALRDNGSKNDWGGFMSRWRKEGFDGELWISAKYNQSEKQTEVTFRKVPLYNSTVWIDKVPESIRIYQSPSNNSGTEIKDRTKIEEITRFINEAIDWNEDMKPRNQSKIVKIGDVEIKVLYEGDKEIYLQSEKGAKMMKPDPRFFEHLGLMQ